MRLPVKESSVQLFFKCIAWGLILIGITIRIVVYIQNRDLFLDEANLARNIFERSFAALAKPLSYEQYAAPVFLWLLKTSTTIFGYGEMAFRLVPLLSSFAALVIMYLLAKRLTSIRSAWYPLGLMVVSFYMIRYATELKQYATDVLVVLSLILLAVEIGIHEKKRKRFLLIWFCAGTVAIWTAMPSVFALAGVGAYYLAVSIKNKNRQQMLTVITVGIFWLLQFGIYYYLVLRPQIESNYLQSFHNNYFLHALPKTAQEWIHNRDLLLMVFQEAAGFSMYYTYINISLFFIGVVAFISKQPVRSLLVLVPIFSVVVAAALHQYSLIPRVALFLMPILLLVVGYGFHQFMNSKWIVLPIIFLIVGLKGIYGHSSVRSMAEKPFQSGQITEAMSFLKAWGITGKDLYVHCGAQPAFIYYTQMHPGKNKWAALKNADLPACETGPETIAGSMSSTIGFLCTSISDEEMRVASETIERQRKLTAHSKATGANAFIYSRK